MWTQGEKRAVNVALGNVRRTLNQIGDNAPTNICVALDDLQKLVDKCDIEAENQKPKDENLGTCFHCGKKGSVEECTCGESICRRCKTEMKASGDACDG